MNEDGKLIIKFELDELDFDEKIDSLKRKVSKKDIKLDSKVNLGEKIDESLKDSINKLGNFDLKLFETNGLLSILSDAFSGLGSAIGDNFNSFLKDSTLMMSSFVIAVQFSLLQATEYLKNFGTTLSKSFEEAYSKFVEYRKESIVFVSTIDSFNRISKDAVGTTDEWSDSISKLSSSFNLSVKDLRKSNAEIIAVGYRIGLTKKEMEQLTEVISGYSVIAGKDLYETTLAFTGALQGQSQAVQKYGVKLTEASNSHYALMHGFKKSFTQMSDSEKYQLRLNNLISQYSVVSNIATKVSNDWLQNNKKLETTLDNINIKLGEGAKLITDYNLYSLITNKFLNLFSDNLIKTFGFIGAFSSRVIYLTGLVLELALKFGILAVAIKMVDTYLQSSSWSLLATKTIPLLNSNLKDLALRLTGSGRELNSIKNIFLTFSEAIINNKAKILGFFFGAGGLASVGGIFTALFAKASVVFSAFMATLASALVAIAPFLAVMTAVYLLFNLLKEAIILIDQETGIFSDTLDSLKGVFQSITGYALQSKTIFQEIGKFISWFVGTQIGYFAANINTLILRTLQGYRLLASAFISDKSKQALDEKIFKLQEFNKKLEVAGYNVNKLTKELNQASKATFEKPKENLEELMNQFKEASEFIKTNPRKLAEELNMRLALVKQNLAAEVISEKQAQEQITIFKAASAKKVVELLNQINTDSILSPEEKASKDYAKSMTDLNAIYNQDLINFTTYNQKKWEIAQVYGNEIQKIIEEQRQKESEKIKESKENAYSMLDIAKATVSAMTNLIGGALERLGASLVNGQTAWADWKSFIFDILGSLMIQVGMGVIGVAVALQGLQAAIASWNWPLALSAGIALVVAGGALKALAGSSKSSEGYQTSPSMPGGSSPGTDYNPINPRENIESAKEQQVVINIQGSLISTEQTSRTLIDMIAKEFDKSGAKIRTRAFA